MGKRAENPDKRYPFTIKFTIAERKWLERMANGLPLATFSRRRLLEGSGFEQKRHTQKLPPAKDHALLARILAMLGASHIAENLKQLAEAVKSGSLPVTPETEEFIQDACKAVIEMRDLLLKALGLRS